MSTIPTTARAIVISEAGEPDVLKLVHLPVTAPGPGEVLIRVEAAGVNPVDAKIRRGIRGDLSPNQRLGADAGGIVVAIGDGAPFSVSDPVIGWGLPGAYADYVTAAATQFTPRPVGVSAAQGAALGIPAGTAYQCVIATGLQAGETLLVHAGAGAVGQAAIQFARRLGAQVIATASQSNNELLRSLGATPVTYGDGLLERVRQAAPEGIDRVLEGAGTQEAIDVSLALVSEPSRIVEIVVAGWHDKYGVQVFSGGLPGSMTPEAVRLRNEAVPLAASLIASGQFRVELGQQFPLGQAVEAHQLIETSHPHGKLVLVP